MKIAISELDRPKIRDLDFTVSEEIIGGDSSIQFSAKAFANGDLSFSKIDGNGWSLKIKTKKGTYDFTLDSQFTLPTFEAVKLC